MNHIRERPISHNKQAYEKLKESIINLSFRPGEYLNTALLMDSLSLGRTPINHALHRLANEGFVQIIPRKGVMVSPLSLDEALSLIEVRCANEVLCVRLAARRIDNPSLVMLNKISARYAQAITRGNLSLIMRIDRAFHECIANAAQNAVLSSILKILHARSQRFWVVSLSKQQHLDEILTEHQAIVDALTAHHPDNAERAIIQHIDSFRQTLMRGASSVGSAMNSI